MLPEVWIQFHYTAPFTVVSVILLAAATRTLWFRMADARIPNQVRGLAVTVGLVVLFTPLMSHYL